MTLTLTLRTPARGPIDASAIIPERLRDLSAVEVAALEIPCDGTPTAVGELFAVTGTGSGDVFLIGELARVEAIGSRMRGGQIVVNGSCGDRVGVGMSGGEILVIGNVGADAGSEMCGGSLTVRGDAGDRLGGQQLRPHASGMTGGEIVITGEAGDAAGAGMRRGLVAVGGRVGAGAARRMLGGMLVGLGGLGAEAGVGNRGGTIVAGAPIEPPGGYALATRYHPPALALQLRELRRRFLPVPAEMIEGLWARWVGDHEQRGRGEIFVYAPSAESRAASSTSIRTP